MVRLIDPKLVREGKQIEAAEVERLIAQDARLARSLGYTRAQAIEKAMKMNVILLQRVLK